MQRPPMTAAAGKATALLIGLIVASATCPAWAQYKIVGPDGRVTYTDLPPPPSTSGSVIDLGRRAAAPAAPEAAVLPEDLQRLAARYPVVLFASDNCEPCEQGRRLLQQRGVPYSERRIVNADDADLLLQRTGARSLPALGVGAQVVRGFSEVDWAAYLDAAGYPRESRLPAGWAPPAPTPLAARTLPSAPADTTVATPAPRPLTLPPPPQPGTIRF